MGHVVAHAVVVTLLLQGPRFGSRTVHVGFVMDEMALGQVFLRAVPFYLVSIIPPMLQIHSSITDSA
jgi:hypothetical protein